MSGGDIERFDWPAIRSMVEAPAYFAKFATDARHGIATDRGLSAEERAAKLHRTRRRMVLRARGQLRNGGELL